MRAQAIEPPVRVNQIPRQVPTQPVYMQPIPAIMIGGILPFGAIFIELFFILSSLWYHRVRVPLYGTVFWQLSHRGFHSAELCWFTLSLAYAGPPRICIMLPIDLVQNRRYATHAILPLQLYFLPVFLFIVYGVLVIICAEVSVLLIYFQLCLEVCTPENGLSLSPPPVPQASEIMSPCLLSAMRPRAFGRKPTRMLNNTDTNQDK